MKTALTQAHIRWLTEPDCDDLKVDVAEGDILLTEIPMPPNTGKGWIECLRLSLGFNISRGIHQFDESFRGQLMPFAEITGELLEPIVMIQSAKSGQVILHDRIADKKMLFGSGYTTFHHIDKMDYVPTLNTDEDVEVFVFKSSENVLKQLVGENFFAHFIEQWGIAPIRSARTHYIPEHISSILYSSLYSPYEGEMHRLHAQAKAIEFLCALTQQASRIAEEKPSILQARRIKEITSELLDLEGRIPSLNELAVRYGMSAKTLNQLFKKEHQQTLLAYIAEQRLHYAHQAMLTTDIPMKVLSARLGYSHVNHFINAFKKLFGYTPGSLRRTSWAI